MNSLDTALKTHFSTKYAPPHIVKQELHEKLHATKAESLYWVWILQLTMGVLGVLLLFTANMMFGLVAVAVLGIMFYAAITGAILVIILAKKREEILV